jgi:hypothetical protein
MSNIGLGSKERDEALKSADISAHGTLDYKQFYNKIRISAWLSIKNIKIYNCFVFLNTVL